MTEKANIVHAEAMKKLDKNREKQEKNRNYFAQTFHIFKKF